MAVLEERAAGHRSNPTPAEKAMGIALRRAREPHERQKIIGSAIVDFYIPRLRLVIEVDGRQHLEPVHFRRDLERTRMIKKVCRGGSVIRVPNLAALHGPTCTSIAKAVGNSDRKRVLSIQQIVDQIVEDCGLPGARTWLARRQQPPHSLSTNKRGRPKGKQGRRGRRRKVKRRPTLERPTAPRSGSACKPKEACEDFKCWGRGRWRARTHVELGGRDWHVCNHCATRLLAK